MMVTSLASNLVDLGFVPVEDRIRYQANALADLLTYCRTHPLTQPRMSAISRELLAESDILSVLSQVVPVNSPDHTDAIRKTGSFSRRSSVPFGSRIVFSTSGTTGQPKLLVNGYQEMLENAVFHGLSYFAAGIREYDTVATFGGNGIFASEYCVYHALTQTGCTIVPINDYSKTLENVALLDDLHVTVLLVMPSELFALVDHLETEKRSLPHIRLVVTGGERLSNQLRERLRTVLGKNVEFGSTFQTADLGTIGYQCDSCRPNEYHVHEKLQFVELIPAEDSSQVGHLVVTNLHRRQMPILRVYSGDMAAWSGDSERCGCGRFARKLVLHGRTNDMIKLGGEKINGSIFMSLAERVGIRENDVVMEITTAPSGKDRLTIYTQRPATSELAAAIAGHIFVDPKLAQMRAESRIEELCFGTMEQASADISVSGKHRVVRDLR